MIGNDDEEKEEVRLEERESMNIIVALDAALVEPQHQHLFDIFFLQ